MRRKGEGHEPITLTPPTRFASGAHPSPDGRGIKEELMTDKGVVAQLMKQAEAEGAGLVTLRALVEEASELGAARALERLGLGDDKARGDMDELRELLSAWRDAKQSARRALVSWIVRVALALLLIGLAVRLRLTELITG